MTANDLNIIFSDIEIVSMFTVKSKLTGKDYTFKIKKCKYNNKFYIHCYVETRYLNFLYLGCYFNGKIIRNKKFNECNAAVSIAYILNKVEKNDFNYLNESIEIMHCGKCLCCGRKLTDALSIERGFGESCYHKIKEYV
jgi:hypothetical protein